MACGLPTVLSDIGPHRELIADPPAGLLCDGADPVSVAESIIALVADPARRIELGRTARRTVETRFAWPTVTAQLAALFP
jgi:glycosyltransferase involved in cell wall biosynthesis